MWYVAHLVTTDKFRTPPVTVKLTCQGAKLSEVIAEAAMRLCDAVELAAGTETPFLEGFLMVGMEVEVWASLSSYNASGRAAEASLRLMRLSAQVARSCGQFSPSNGTPTTPHDFPLNW